MVTEDIKVVERDHAEYDISYEKWIKPKPQGLSGCFRLKNEAEFIVHAVESHIEWLDEVVLVVQPCTDRTLILVQKLQEKYPQKIKLFHYPFLLYQFNTFGHFYSPPNSVYTLTHFTNWALAQCSYSWIAKIEGDVIAMSSFGNIVDRLEADYISHRYYGRVGLNVAGPMVNYVSKPMPRNAGWDEGVFPNHPKWHCVKSGKWETINFGDYPQKRRNNGFDFYHVRRCKRKVLSTPNDEAWIPFERGPVSEALTEFDKRYPWPAEGDSCPDYIFEEEKECLYRRLGIGLS